jgi:hypothetical protein
MADSRGQDTAYRYIIRTRIKRSRRSNRRSSGARVRLRRPAASVSPMVVNTVIIEAVRIIRNYNLQSGRRYARY